MRRSRQAVLFLLLVLLVSGCSARYELDYDQMVLLDAESLAETGIGEAYEELLPKLVTYVPQPAPLEEVENSEQPSYSVRSQAIEYVVYRPGLSDSEGQAWGRATFAFFDIVNRQLADSTHRFYAINGGNDLGGIFLTEAECDKARQSLPRRTDWPYIPTEEEPWFGQFH